jgi:hypothetical protein
MRRIMGSLLGVALALNILVVPAFASGSPFQGSWTSTDSDGSHQTLHVSAGSTPSVVFQDFYASGCDLFGGPSTHWTANGQGSVDGDDLFVDFHKSGCGTFLKGGYGDYWTYEPATDTLLDSVGITWSRAN